jgi:hypothetical protein
MATKKVDFIVSEKGTSKAAGGFKKVDNSIAKAAKSAALYAGAYIGARGIINLTKNAIEAFGVQEDAEKRLTTALGKNADALIKQAGALQQVSTFGDEVIIGVQASIAAFVRDEGAIKRATAATLDLAAATGMDLKSAGDLVAKSLGSSTNALSRYGIEVTGAESLGAHLLKRKRRRSNSMMSQMNTAGLLMKWLSQYRPCRTILDQRP